MKSNSFEQQIKQKLATMSGTDANDWFIVSRSRHAMEQVFTQIKSRHGGGSVITQPFTCVTAVNPIIVSGLKPVYCDISEKTLTIDKNKLSKVMDDNARAIVVQHSFGIPANVVEIKEIAFRHGNPMIIEDSAHCLGYISKQSNVPNADVSLHSFGSEKMISTNFGGAIWLNPAMIDKELYQDLADTFSRVKKTSFIVNVRVLLYPHLNRILHHTPNIARHFVRQTLLCTRLFRPPIMPIEQKAKTYEKCQKPREFLMKNILKALDTYDENCLHRSELTQYYCKTIDEVKSQVEIPVDIKENTLACVRLPIIASTKQRASDIFTSLKTSGYNPGKWYRPLLFPGVYDEQYYNYEKGKCPVAENISERIVNLPTNFNTSRRAAKEISNAINRSTN